MHVVGLCEAADIITRIVPRHPISRYREPEGLARDRQEREALSHRLDIGLPELVFIETFVVQADLEGLRRSQQVLLRVLPVEDGEPADGYGREQ